MVFGNFDRTDSEPSRYQESSYDFYNRCNSVAISKIRCEIEQWASRYPVDFRDELEARFPSEFESAFFELFLHELLLRQELTVGIHPNVGSKGRRPDFEVRSQEASEAVIVEATLCFDEMTDDGQSPQIKPIYDAVNRISCPAFFIGIRDVVLKSKEQPSIRRIRCLLEQEVERVDPESLLKTVEDGGACPTVCYDDDVVKMVFEFIPKKREAWGRTGVRPIGMLPISSRWGDGTEAIRKALNAKAKRYGALGLPFVIAVNTLGSWGHGEDERRGVLFGKNQEYVAAGTGELCRRILRDGFWGTANRPKHTRVSAVVLGAVFPSNVRRAKLCLYLNPWAMHPLAPSFWRLPVAMLCDGQILRSGNMTPGQILGLPDNWPGELFEELNG
jgi:hypothetical protein